MQEKDIKLLFDSGCLRVCIVVRNPFGDGYNALFARTGSVKPDISLETRKRLASDDAAIRVFKTVDSACSLVKRQIGLRSFVVEL